MALTTAPPPPPAQVDLRRPQELRQPLRRVLLPSASPGTCRWRRRSVLGAQAAIQAVHGVRCAQPERRGRPQSAQGADQEGRRCARVFAPDHRGRHHRRPRGRAGVPQQSVLRGTRAAAPLPERCGSCDALRPSDFRTAPLNELLISVDPLHLWGSAPPTLRSRSQQDSKCLMCWMIDIEVLTAFPIHSLYSHHFHEPHKLHLSMYPCTTHRRCYGRNVGNDQHKTLHFRCALLIPSFAAAQ
eukprot:SM000168S02591  [mRNA]  locus=s168:65378:66669:- [translate_table: standard]